MATRIEAFRSDAGKVFDTEHEALKDDLRSILGEATQNDPIAASATKHITDSFERLEQFATLFRQLLGTHPQTPAIAKAELPMPWTCSHGKYTNEHCAICNEAARLITGNNPGERI